MKTVEIRVVIDTKDRGFTMKTIEVVAAIILKDNSVLIAQRQKGEFAGMWEFPGGKIESGETHDVALRREILEELNLLIKVDDFLITIDYEYPSFYLVMHCYLCSAISDHFENVEHKEVKFISINELNKQNWIPADLTVIDSIMQHFLLKQSC